MNKIQKLITNKFSEVSGASSENSSAINNKKPVKVRKFAINKSDENNKLTIE